MRSQGRDTGIPPPCPSPTIHQPTPRGPPQPKDEPTPTDPGIRSPPARTWLAGCAPHFPNNTGSHPSGAHSGSTCPRSTRLRKLGAQNTEARIRDRLHWPGMTAEVRNFCQRCPTCQRTPPRMQVRSFPFPSLMYLLSVLAWAKHVQKN